MPVTVYRVEFYDAQNDEMIVSRRWFTRAGAERVTGLMIESTATEVDDASLEPGEQWTFSGFHPRATTVHRGSPARALKLGECVGFTGYWLKRLVD